MSELRNGEVWKQPEFPCCSRVLQWIGGNCSDEWMLMAMEDSCWGGKVMAPAHDRDGKYLYTKAEASALLTRLKYKPTGKDFIGNELLCNDPLAAAS